MQDYSNYMYEQQYHDQDLTQYSFLVTGGAGFIGSNIVEYLIKYKAGKIRILDNFSTGSRSNIKGFVANPSVEVIEGDIRDYDVCKMAVQEMDFVSHQAALGSVPRSIENPLLTNEVNIHGFLNMLTAAKEAKLKRFVYAASSSTYGDHPALPKTESQIGNPLSPYAVTKYVNELYADVFSKVYNYHTIGLRYFNVFGPKQSPNGPYAAVIPLFIHAALKKESPVINGDGETSRDFTYIENVVQANIKALLHADVKKHDVLNIACGDQTTLNQLLSKISDIASYPIKPVYQKERSGDVQHSLASINKAKKVIGYNPQISVAEGLKRAYEWYQTLNAS